MADCISTKVKETRLLLVGRTGSGKSSTGNSILGDKVFSTSLALSSSTATTSYKECVRYDRRVVVVDTPGFFDTVRSNHDIIREISKVFGYLSSGFHAMLFVVSPERFTKESVKSKQLFFRTFGDGVKKYTILILTNYDRIQEDGVTDFKDYIKQCGPEFRALYKDCSGRIIAFNNKATGMKMESQVRSLFEMVDIVNRDNYGNVYSTFHFRLVRAFTRVERRKTTDKNKARKHLFTRASQQLGMENTVWWDSEKDRPVRISAMALQAELQKNVPVRSTSDRNKKIKPIPVLSVTTKLKNSTERKTQTDTEKDSEKKTPETTRETEHPEVASTNSEALFSKISVESDATNSNARIDSDDLFLRDIENDPNDTDQSECKDSDEFQEDRCAAKDPSFISKLVDFISVFIEKLVSSEP